MSKIRVTQSRSTIKANKNQKLTIQALGLKNPNDAVEHEHTPQIEGMLRKVIHLVHVEKLS
ncbi:MAG: 50S ribosomal protein L30 [Saprospiraceae bacterium]|nr:50S ribosomal protein L30 [Saprospiraceae bacterium]